MVFSYIAPDPALGDFVRGYLIAHFVFDPGEPTPRKPYAPKPEQGITFFVKGRPSMVDPLSATVHHAPPVSIFGQQTSRCDVHLPAEFLMFRVHFQPGALFRALNVPLCGLDSSYFDAELVLEREVREVSEQLAAARSYREMVARVEAFLGHTLKRAKQQIHRVDRAARWLMGDARDPSIDWLAGQACLSPRQLHRQFTERIGVGPKLFSRVARFHRTLLYKAAHPAIAWPSVAIRCGYTDYQHMARDFKQFAHATPNAWLQQDAASPEKRPICTTHVENEPVIVMLR